MRIGKYNPHSAVVNPEHYIMVDFSPEEKKKMGDYTHLSIVEFDNSQVLLELTHGKGAMLSFIKSSGTYRAQFRNPKLKRIKPQFGIISTTGSIDGNQVLVDLPKEEERKVSHLRGIKRARKTKTEESNPAQAELPLQPVTPSTKKTTAKPLSIKDLLLQLNQKISEEGLTAEVKDNQVRLVIV